jgi:hypothetical protein
MALPQKRDETRGLLMDDSPAEFKPEQRDEPKTYRRQGTEAYFDPCRKMLIPAGPEEDIRQRFIRYLLDEIGVPQGNISTEVPLARFEDGRQGRADIVVFHHVDEQKVVPLCVVECKSRETPLTDDTAQQVMRYNKVLEATSGILVITNGRNTFWYHHEAEDNLQVVDGPVSFKEMRKKSDYDYASAPTPFPRPDIGDFSASEKFEDAGILGKESPEEHYDFLFNLIGLIYFEKEPPEFTHDFDGYSFLKSGMRLTTYGNVSGGNWTGYYRYFLLEDREGNNQLVSLSVMGKAEEFTSHTMLLVAVDNFHNQHLSLQHDMDRLSRRDNQSVELYHDGRLSLGRGGSAKHSEVIEFVSEHEPDLVEGDEIKLGRIPTNELLKWQQATDIVERCIRYALVRDRFRDYYTTA